uniref:Disease resistance protein RGA2 n=1 Tax=Rhizophora mucronata TaxID=61149 RepID=A0A2P2MPK1_RHIMU
MKRTRLKNYFCQISTRLM